MPQRPFVSFADVKERISIPDVLVILGIADQFVRKGAKLCGVCPLPGHQHGPQPNPEQFKIDCKKGIWLWHCFGDCGRGGDVVELVKAITGYDNSHVRFWFAEHFADRLVLRTTNSGEMGRERKGAREETDQSSPSQAPSLGTSKPPPPAPSLKPLRFTLNLDPDVPYLRQRGLTTETIRRYSLGLCKRGSLKGYVAIPLFDYPRRPNQNPVAYLGRWPGDDYEEDEGRPRYKAPSGFEISRVVYGLQEALEASSAASPLVVVEGPFKVYHLVQAGFPSTVSCLSASISEEQAAILAATGRPIVLFFDGNEAGYRGMRTAAARLITHSFVRVVKLPEREEPDSFEPWQLRKLLPSV